MNTADIKLNIFRMIDSLTEDKLYEIQKLVHNLQSELQKEEKTQKYKHLKELIANPIKIEKINILSRDAIYERKNIH